MGTSAKRVAVVAIHGVADQPPDETVRRVGDLLLRLKKPGVTYTAFSETELRLAVHEAVPALVGGLQPRRAAEAFRVDPRSPTFREMHRRPAGQAIPEALEAMRRAAPQSEPARQRGTGEESLDIAYMREQLAGYQPSGSDALYETVRLAGSRLAAEEVAAHASGAEAPVQRCEVHLHEMYWADLSRADTAFLRLIIEFYQLLFYLCGLGRKSLDFVRAHHPRDYWWNTFGWCQVAAERCLVLAVPVLNLCLLGLASVLLPVHLPPQFHAYALVGTVAALGAAALGLVFYLRRLRGKPERWPWRVWWVLLAGAVLCGLVFLFPRQGGLFKPLAGLGWLVAAVLIAWLMRIYQRRQPGAFVFALVGLGLMTVAYAVSLGFVANDRVGVLAAALRTAEWAFLVLAACWIAYGLLALATSIAGIVAVRRVPQAERPAARRAAWTVNLTLTLPGLAVALLNLVLWKALYLVGGWAGGQFFIPLDQYKPLPWLSVLVGLNPSEMVNTRSYVGVLIDATASPSFAIGFVLALLAVLLAAWSMVPVILSEFRTSASTLRETVWLGRCLSRGFVAMRISGEVLRGLLVIGIPAGYLVTLWASETAWYGTLKPYAPWLLAGLGAVVGMAATGKGWFGWLTLGFRSGLDIALDVANWLRLHPADDNPKARISARFVSLLRHLCQWRDPDDGEGYAAIILVAHSQGTVIAAEVLRFLRRQAPDPMLAPLGQTVPLYLFTMGCPLRQLYGLRFPQQYGWARHEYPRWPGFLPDPTELLGVNLWVNAYRSGDYVGRYLWFPEQGLDRWRRRQDDRQGRVEFCIGAGGHNHYWDETAPAIAEELDRLIARACGCGGTSARENSPGVPAAAPARK